jgi:hypothetical protein
MHWLKFVKNWKYSLSALSCWGMLLFFSPAFSQESSVLASGTWYKIAIVQTGVYQIDYNMLREMGIEASTIAPDRIQIYGNGGRMLPQANNAARPRDLVQNAILVKGQEDGRFDANDLIYFYGEGTTTINYDSVKASLSHQINTYSDTSYYFLTIGENKGLRIKSQASLLKRNPVVKDQFDDYWFYEKESVNLLHSGREWWGEYLATSSAFNIPASIPGLVPDSDMLMLTSAISNSYVKNRFLWQINGKDIGQTTTGTIQQNQYDPKGTYDQKGIKSDAVFKVKAASQPMTLSVAFDKSSQTSAQAYLNFVALQVKRELRPYDKQQIYRFLPAVQDTISYVLKDLPADWQWWNISNPALPVISLPATDGVYTENGGKTLKEFAGFTPAQALKPIGWRRIPNQNIVSGIVPDLLIITSAAWLSEAKRLVAFREDHDGMSTAVVTIPEIFNEFSSGKTDVTALRDFIRTLYNRDPARLKYVLLFGDATYDYKNILQNQTVQQRQSWVPVYESRESLDPIYTYSSDDYFGFMEAREGEWLETVAGDHSMEIGVGRLPVKSVSEARIVVDKLINYASKPSLGAWRNSVRFVADDGDGATHQQHADELEQLIQPALLSGKIFLDAYPQTTTALGQKVPEASAAIRKSINDGSLIVNYIGHGGTSGWAEEQVLTLGDMQTARGYNNLPLLITATCDFGRYDDPGLVSGGELMVLSPRGAAIATVSTTRPVYSSTNFTINKAFYQSVLDLGSTVRMGDIIKRTKNNSLVGSLNRNFALLGDPSMRLARGLQQIRWLQRPDTLRAMQKVSLQGGIYNTDESQIDATFTGTARITVFDKQVNFKTLGTEGTAAKEYSEFRSKLFDGSVAVKNGQFTCEFVMPKDIDYRFGLGRVSAYAVASDSTRDASAQLDVLVGGSAIATDDREAPKVSGYMNEPAFRNGDVIPSSSVLFLKLSDQNGINVSKAGIGHDILLTLNDTLNIILNDFYIADTDSYASGTIRYPFENLPSGKYTIRIKVWDTYNNSSELAFGFQVGTPSGIKISAFKVYPNPFDQEFSFELNHNRADEDVEIVLNLFQKTGQHLVTLKWQYYNSERIIRETIPSLHLKSLNVFGLQYLYSLEIRSLKDNSLDKRSGKLSRVP